MAEPAVSALGDSRIELPLQNGRSLMLRDSRLGARLVRAVVRQKSLCCLDWCMERRRVDLRTSELPNSGRGRCFGTEAHAALPKWSVTTDRNSACRLLLQALSARTDSSLRADEPAWVTPPLFEVGASRNVLQNHGVYKLK